MNNVIGIVLIAVGIFSLYRAINGKAKESERIVFFHQLAIFQFLFGKNNAYKALVIFTSIIEIAFGLAFLFGELKIN